MAVGYFAVAANQTAFTLGTNGQKGDRLAQLIVIPASRNAGNVIILDGSSSMTAFMGGFTSLASLQTFTINIGTVSNIGAWQITTGSGVSVIAIGRFS